MPFMRIAPPVHLTDEDRDWLIRTMKSTLTSKRLSERCSVVLLAAKGKRDDQIGRKLKITRQKAARWRKRFLQSGRTGIESDEPGRGRKPTYTPEIRRLVVRLTTQETPKAATHWSRQSMAKELGLSPSTVGRVWREHGLKPHLARTFKVSKDPRFAEKLEDIVGLYLNAPEHAIVLCCDEKSQVQALDRTQPGLPLKKGRAGTMTHDYVRHGTTTLFAALNVADGKIIGQCQNRHRHQEWLQFLKLIDQQMPPDRELHLILDNYATHKHASVKKWLSKHPHFHLHFTPTGASWLNMVERFFREVTEKRLRRGVFHSVPDLVSALEEYLTCYNENPTPFVWTAKANDILKKVERARKKLSKSIKYR
jgi:transposase